MHLPIARSEVQSGKVAAAREQDQCVIYSREIHQVSSDYSISDNQRKKDKTENFRGARPQERPTGTARHYVSEFSSASGCIVGEDPRRF